ATGMLGGDYSANILVNSNDPVNPQATATADLHVTGAPAIAVTPDSLVYDSVYTVVTDTATFTVENTGTDVLTLSGMSTPMSEFTILGSTSFTLSIGQTQDVDVTFNSAVVGTFIDSIVISSDASNGDVVVYLAGESIEPPVIGVAPSSFTKSLLTGEVEVDTFTISNTGLGTLDYSITIESTTLEASVFVNNSRIKNNRIMAVGKPVSLSELEKMRGSVKTRVNIGVNDVDEGVPFKQNNSIIGPYESIKSEEIFGSNQNVYNAGPRSRGNLFTCTTSTVLTEFRGYHNPSVATQMWFLVYEGAAQVGIYNLVSASDVSPAGPGEGWYSSGPISVPMNAGSYYLMTCSFEQITSYYNEQNIVPYPIPASFGELTAGAGFNWSPTSVYPPNTTQDVTALAFGSPTAYYQTIVTGAGTSWLSVAPESGSVLPGASDEVQVTFDATGKLGGDYNADIIISSNDPLNPVATVTADLHVTGAPDISVYPDTLDYETIYTVVSDTMTFTVENSGTDVLSVTGITNSTSEFTILGLTSFTLNVGETADVDVVFASSTAGSYTDMITVTSNGTSGDKYVDLLGVTIDPPVVGVNPTSFTKSLSIGEVESDTLTISNTGLSDLEFDLIIEEVTEVSISPNAVTPGVTDIAMDRAGAILSGVIINNIPEGYSKYLNRPESSTPDFMYYKFDEVGSSTTQNFATPATRVNDFATLEGLLT
ncbi:MAG: choice-of-anchor D domain-containing protein, partial [Gammaproteobacteria bacterium]|nr:choice-of-anchor D domain-containing protein [Gammaproteobacteria bacterium]